MWGILAFGIGLLYGWLTPGRQGKARLLWNGLWIGLAVALVFLLIGLLAGSAPLGLAGGWAIFVTVLVLTLLFVLGAWVGDLIEGGVHRRRHSA